MYLGNVALLFLKKNTQKDCVLAKCDYCQLSLFLIACQRLVPVYLTQGEPGYCEGGHACLHNMPQDCGNEFCFLPKGRKRERGYGVFVHIKMLAIGIVNKTLG